MEFRPMHFIVCTHHPLDSPPIYLTVGYTTDDRVCFTLTFESEQEAIAFADKYNRGKMGLICSTLPPASIPGPARK